MSLLQLLDGYLEAAGWELNRAAASLGLPPPPVLKLPPVPAVSTSCDLAALAGSLGSAAAATLKAQLGSPDISALLSGDLSGVKTQLDSYAAMIDSQITAVTNDLLAQTGLMDALGTARSTLGGLRETLGSAEAAIPPEIMVAVSAACPAAGYALNLAETALGNADAEIQGVSSLITAGQEKLAGLLSAKALADGLAAQLQARLTALPGVLAVFA